MKQLKFNLLLCLLILSIGSAHAQIPLNWAAFRDAAGLKPIELRTGYNGGSDKLSHKGLNNSGSDNITYYGVHETSLPRYNYSLQLNSYTNNYNYAYLLFDFVQWVPSYARAKVTWTNSCIHLYNMANTVTESAAAFYVFDTVDKARNAALVSKPSSARPADPVDGKLYYYVYSNASSGVGIGSTTYNGATTYFDNSTSSSDRNITKGAMLTTCAKNGNRYQKSFLLIRPNSNGVYVNKDYDYYKHITFNNNGGTGTMTQQTVENSAAIKANTFTREGFTFAGWNTKADGTGTKYDAGAQIVADENSKGPVTLFAQWTANTITATFDYTYRTSKKVGGNYVVAYEHMNNEHESAAITTKVRANFRNASGAVLKSVVLTAPAATTPGGTPTDNISTHNTAAITLNVVASGTENLSGDNCTVVLGATDYANYRTVDFEVMKEDASAVAPHWVSDKISATSYVFKYEGHESENMYELTWRVNLKNLSMYPADIFVKPMRESDSVKFDQISPMIGKDGEVCELAGYIKSDNSDITLADYNALTYEQKQGITIAGAYYTGEYNVLKTDAKGDDYTYRLGLTGFTLDGIIYYLAANHGDIPTDMISTATVSSASDKKEIVFDRFDKDIPVLILNPGTGGTVGGKTNYMLYVDNHAAREVNLAQFEALRPGYTFLGWKDARDDNNNLVSENNKVYGKDANYTFTIGTKSTTTLVAQWERTNAPKIALNDLTEGDENFAYTVNITDDLGILNNVKYIYATGDNAPAADDSGWTNLSLTGGVGTIVLSLLNEEFGKNLWVMASNESKTSVVNLGTVRSIYKVKANPDPDSHTTEDIEETHVNYYDYYSTFFYSDHTFIADNATVYTAQISGNHLDLTEIKPTSDDALVIIPKGTAVILRKKQAIDGNIVLEEYNGDVPTLYGTNNLEGVDENTTQDGDNYYIFSYAQKGLGFYLNSSTTLAAHKAFIRLENGQSAARAFTLNFGDSETTGIRDIETEVDTDALYDLSGRKVSAPSAQGGIYIKGGKKIIIKK